MIKEEIIFFQQAANILDNLYAVQQDIKNLENSCDFVSLFNQPEMQDALKEVKNRIAEEEKYIRSLKFESQPDKNNL